MARTKPATTISDIFEEFLADQKDRISHKTFLKYQSIIGLYKSYLEGYWPGHDGEYDKITKAGGTYCDTFGPEDATSGYSEFLGYFMPRKVMCGKDTMQARGLKIEIPHQDLLRVFWVESQQARDVGQCRRTADAALVRVECNKHR